MGQMRGAVYRFKAARFTLEAAANQKCEGVSGNYLMKIAIVCVFYMVRALKFSEIVTMAYIR